MRYFITWMMLAFPINFAYSNHWLKTKDRLNCYICDSLTEGQELCNQPQTKSSPFIGKKGEVMLGALGWPVCFSVKSKDNSVVMRGFIHSFDGFAEWKPDFAGCKGYYDKNLELDMTVCLCYSDLCNKSGKYNEA